MRRSIGVVMLVLIATAANGTAAASVERGDDARANRERHSHARPTLGVFDDSLKSLRLEGTDRFTEDSAGKDNRDNALAKSRRDAGHHPRAPGHYAMPGDNHAPSQPVPEPISAILFASGALVVGCSVRRPLGSSD